MGEGYHNYHHEFQHDYRNGVKPWQFDPTKRLIWTLSKLDLSEICAASRQIRFAWRNEKLASESLARRLDERAEVKLTGRECNKEFPELS
jgi:stearoyl-CoA desaturase (delta-9 desaturase)